MRHNMGTADRIIRAVVVAPALVILALVVAPTMLVGLVFVVLAGVMLFTSALGSCPIYVPLGIDTHRRTPGAA